MPDPLPQSILCPVLIGRDVQVFDLPAARMHLEQALQLAKAIGAHEFLNTVIGVLASTLIARGDWAQAQAVLQASPLAGRSLRARRMGRPHGNG